MPKKIALFLYEKHGISQYSLIKNVSRLISSQVSKNISIKKYYCKKYLSYFVKEEPFLKHISYCSVNEKFAVKIPPKNSKRFFKNDFKKLPIPFVVYADVLQN